MGWPTMALITRGEHLITGQAARRNRDLMTGKRAALTEQTAPPDPRPTPGSTRCSRREILWPAESDRFRGMTASERVRVYIRLDDGCGRQGQEKGEGEC